MIRLSNLGKVVLTGGSNQLQILNHVDLQIDEGELIGIVGSSGSGKSTLLNIIGLLDRSSSGAYLLDGQPVMDLSGKQRDALRSRTFGLVFQAFHLLESRSVDDNVRLGLLHAGVPRREHDQLVSEALASVNLSHRSSFPSRTLSGGEKQRAAIARAVAGSKRVILCDEPTGNLDSQSTQGIIDLLVQLRDAGRTIVIVTHDPTVAASCSRIVEMQDGRLRDTTSTVAG